MLTNENEQHSMELEAEQTQPSTTSNSKEKPFGEEAIRILQSASWVDEGTSELSEVATFAGGCFW